MKIHRLRVIRSRSRKPNEKIAIIGAGFGGLSAAWDLVRGEMRSRSMKVPIIPAAWLPVSKKKSGSGQ